MQKDEFALELERLNKLKKEIIDLENRKAMLSKQVDDVAIFLSKQEQNVYELKNELQKREEFGKELAWKEMNLILREENLGNDIQKLIKKENDYVEYFNKFQADKAKELRDFEELKQRGLNEILLQKSVLEKNINNINNLNIQLKNTELKLIEQEFNLYEFDIRLKEKQNELFIKEKLLEINQKGVTAKSEELEHQLDQIQMKKEFEEKFKEDKKWQIQ